MDMDNTLLTGTSIPVSELMETQHSKEIPSYKNIGTPEGCPLVKTHIKAQAISLPYSPHINMMYIGFRNVIVVSL